MKKFGTRRIQNSSTSEENFAKNANVVEENKKSRENEKNILLTFKFSKAKKSCSFRARSKIGS
jgi:hypothetical protein